MTSRFYIVFFLFLISQICLAQSNSAIFDSQEKRDLKADEYYELGNELLYEGNYQKAIKHFGKAIILQPKESAYYLQRAQAYELINESTNALTDYEIAIILDPTNPNAYFKRGLIYLYKKNYKVAIEDFTLLLEYEFPNETKAIIFKGNIINESTGTTFNSIVTMDNMQADIYNARAGAYAGLGENGLAMDDYSKAIEENPNATNYLINRGLLYLQLKDSGNAVLDFKSALKIDENDNIAMYNLSLISSTKDSKSLNAQMFSQGQFAQVYSKRGYDKFLNEDYKGALNDYDSALILRPIHAKDMMNRGLVKARLKRYLEANKDFLSSLDQDRNLNRNYVHLANSYQELKDFQKAINYYQLYLTLMGNDAGVYYNKGIAEHSFGKKTAACKSLKRALDLGAQNARLVLEKVCE